MIRTKRIRIDARLKNRQLKNPKQATQTKVYIDEYTAEYSEANEEQGPQEIQTNYHVDSAVEMFDGLKEAKMDSEASKKIVFSRKQAVSNHVKSNSDHHYGLIANTRSN